MKYQKFIYKNYDFNDDSKVLQLNYSFDNDISFTETYRFDFELSNYDLTTLDRALQTLFFMAGVSYYKTYLATEIEVENGQIDAAGAKFFSKTYQRGLGEFFYLNHLDPRTPVNFPINQSESNSSASTSGTGLLIGLGGGKDSLVSVELLRKLPKVATWSVGHKPQLTPLVETIGLPHFWVERQWDRSLLEHNSGGAYNGHVPISGILGAVGVVVAILSGYRDVVVSNENSANEPTLRYKDMAINHQYSKSLEFEQDFQAHLQRQFGESVQYYSFLRPLSELRIAELFADFGFAKYKNVFSSCNRAFTHDSHSLFWCGKCPKCAFVFLALTPFVERTQLEHLFCDKNLLLTREMEPLYRQLLGIEGDKPLDCVGEIKESRAAMSKAQKQYPELKEYKFDLPGDFDYRNLATHAMPDELFSILMTAL